MLKISKRLLILCEDKKSSQVYLDSFKKDEELKRDLTSVNIEIYQPRDHSPLGLVNEAKRRKKIAKMERNPFYEIWIVLDRDGHANFSQAIEMAIDNKIKIALSIICFEYWILLHYKRTTKAFAKCDDIIKEIKKHYFADYEKCSNCYYELKDKISNAISNGEWVERQVQVQIQRGTHFYNLNAYTNIHKLVKQLFEPNKYLNN